MSTLSLPYFTYFYQESAIDITNVLYQLFYKGVNIYITVWDADAQQQQVPYDLVDEFNFNFTDTPGAQPLVRFYDGVRQVPKSR